ncbi:MAG: SUMF1/EgtB/PvdO family nonheme iron enzyme [Balneolaceae bacterium]|nr:SUMF1/EgtB/PvdO family nonheme iron enzyme [Balneolaceae bacterium]
MIEIEGGEFLFGDFYELSNTDALPLHQVKVKSFLIGKYEVTFEQYDDFALKTGRELPNDGAYGREKRAVVDVTWDDALAFCKSLGYRLPSEIEWEYAARSGGKNHVISGTDSLSHLKDFAIVRSSGINFSFMVGTKKPNELGLYDMSGNVFEWIDEFYQFYSLPDQKHDNDADAIRIIRGGSFGEEEMATRTYWRVGTLRDVKATDIGFRCAKSL